MTASRHQSRRGSVTRGSLRSVLESAVTQVQQAVGEGHQRRVVGGDEGRALRAVDEIAQQSDHLPAGAGVQLTGRLVGQ